MNKPSLGCREAKGETSWLSARSQQQEKKERGKRKGRKGKKKKERRKKKNEGEIITVEGLQS